MRLLRCLIMVLAAMSMLLSTVVGVSASMAREGRVLVAHADHHHAGAARHNDVGLSADSDRPCQPGHHQHDRGCCDTLCCGSPCLRPIVVEGAFARAFRPSVRLLPYPDAVPDGMSSGRLIRPPIVG